MITVSVLGWPWLPPYCAISPGATIVSRHADCNFFRSISDVTVGAPYFLWKGNWPKALEYISLSNVAFAHALVLSKWPSFDGLRFATDCRLPGIAVFLGAIRQPVRRPVTAVSSLSRVLSSNSNRHHHLASRVPTFSWTWSSCFGASQSNAFHKFSSGWRGDGFHAYKSFRVLDTHESCFHFFATPLTRPLSTVHR